MESQHSSEADREALANRRSCPQCDNNRVTTSIHEHEYVYGSGESAVRLWVEIPVRTCNQCKLSFTDWETELIEHNALCQHFGVLNPAEVKHLREKYGMTRTAFSQLTGIGEASLSRWEKGVNLQSLAHDRYLRLLNDPAILNRLKRTVFVLDAENDDIPDNIIPFPHLKDRKELEAEQRSFELRAMP